MDARRKTRYLLEYTIFRTIVFILRCLPVRSTVRFADSVGWFMHCVIPRKITRYSVCEENLRRAFGDEFSEADIERTVGGMWRHLAHMVLEILHIERRFRLYNNSDVLDYFGRNECVRAVIADRPVLFLGGHFGNWEISVNTFGHFGFPMGVVARDLDNPWLHQWFLRFRESTGNWMISKSGASSELVEVMEAGGMASLLCDQDAGRRGVFVDFFGHQASTFKSIALLALQYDALVVVGGAYRLPDEEQQGSRWRQFNLATVDVIDSRDFQDSNGVKGLTQRFTSALEDLVVRAPEQYFWVHRRWKTEPRKKKPRGIETKKAA